MKISLTFYVNVVYFIFNQFLAVKENNMFASFLSDESGATLIEYGLILALVSGTIFLFVADLGSAVSNTFNGIASLLSGAIT